MTTSRSSYFPSGIRFSQPKGGLVLWVEMPGGLPSKAVFEQAIERGILVAPGLMFANSNRYDHYMRLNCGMSYASEVDLALRELGGIVQGLLSN